MLKRTVRGTIVWALVLRRTDVWAESENIHGSCLLRWTSIWSLTLMSVLFMSLVMSVFPLVCLRCISRSWSDLLYAMFSAYIFFHRFLYFFVAVRVEICFHCQLVISGLKAVFQFSAFLIMTVTFNTKMLNSVWFPCSNIGVLNFLCGPTSSQVLASTAFSLLKHHLDVLCDLNLQV